MTEKPSDESINDRITTELVDMLFAGSRVAVATTFVGPVLVAWLFFPLVGAWLSVGPAAAIMCLHLERAWYIARFQRARQQAGFVPTAWAQGTQRRLMVMGSAISLWVLAATFTRNPTAIFYSTALPVILAAGSLQYSVYPRTVESYLTPLLLGCCLQLVWLGAGYRVAAFFLFMAWLTLIAASRRFGRAMRNNIELRLRNEQLNEALTAQKAFAEEASAAKSRFLSAASHDLRQPVQAVMLLSEALHERAENAHNQALLHKLRAGVHHFANSVDEIMDIAQMDSGNVKVDLVPVRVEDLFDRLENTYREIALSKGLSLIMRPSINPDLAVCADPVLVWRVMSNLLGNAVRYTHEGCVMVAVRQGGFMSGVDGTLCPAVRIEVRDSGIGIPAELHERVFEEFFQADNSHRDRREGVGLGLSVARRLARLMGLRLGLRSQPGKGSVFSLTLPICDRDASPDNPLTEPPLSLQGLVVLVVDDDPSSRDATLALLSSWQVRALGAGNAAEAAACADACVSGGDALSALLTDHWLPDGESSSDVDHSVRTVLQTRGNHHTTMLNTAVITGDSRPETRDAVLARGWTFWQKPLRPHELRQWLGQIAATHGDTDPTPPDQPR